MSYLARGLQVVVMMHAFNQMLSFSNQKITKAFFNQMSLKPFKACVQEVGSSSSIKYVHT